MLNRRNFLIFPLAALCLSQTNAFAQDKPIRDQVVALVDHAIAEYAKQGQSVLEDMNDPYGEYRRGALYIFVVGTDGITKANAGNTTAVGDHVDEVLDVDGSSIGVRMRQIASEDGAWMTYSFTNPATGKVQTKHSWVRLHQDLIFGSGFYDE